MTKISGRGIAALVALFALFSSASMAQDLFRWTDELGRVHFSDIVPYGVENYERVSLSPAPAVTATPAVSLTTNASVAEATAVPPEPDVAKTEPSVTLSIEELNARCEDAREAAIAPLRTAAIAECRIGNPRSDPGFCERFNATLGDATRLADGRMSERMFDDLPECVEADSEWRRRALE